MAKSPEVTHESCMSCVHMVKKKIAGTQANELKCSRRGGNIPYSFICKHFEEKK